jgi:small-conductance mechanosensitive channel
MLAEATACAQALAEDQAPSPPLVRVMELADWSVNLRLFVWVPDMKAYHVARAHLLEAIKKSFDANGVEIPYPHRVVIQRQDSPPAAPSGAGD